MLSNPNEFDNTLKNWFHIVYQYEVNKNQENIWLRKSTDALSIGKLYVLSIEPDYQCSEECGFDSNENYTVHKGKPERVKTEQAAKIAKTSKLIFGKLIDGDQFATCV